jgi:hypothetical protein
LRNVAEALREVKENLSQVSSEMDVFSNLASIQNKLGKGETVAFSDVKDLLADMPNLLPLILDSSLGVKQEIIDAAVAEQEQEILQALADTIFKDKQLLVSMFPGVDTATLTPEMVKEQVRPVIANYVQGIMDGFIEEARKEESPFEVYLKEMLAQINKEQIEKVFSGTALFREVGAMTQLLMQPDGANAFLSAIASIADASEGSRGRAMFDALKELDEFNNIVYELESGQIGAAEAARRLTAALTPLGEKIKEISNNYKLSERADKKFLDEISQLQDAFAEGGTMQQGIINM